MRTRAFRLIKNGVLEEIASRREGAAPLASLDHVALTESHTGVAEDPTEPYDDVHTSSVAPTPEGNVISSAR